MRIHRTAVWVWAVAEITGCRAAAHDVATHHADTEVSLVDPFRYLRGLCYETEEALVRHESTESQFEKSEIDALGEAEEDLQIEIVSGHDQAGHTSVVVQRYDPAEGDATDILSFEAWKEKQFQEALGTDLPLDPVADPVSEHDRLEQGDEENAHKRQPPVDENAAEQKQENKKETEQVKKREDAKPKSGGSSGKSSTNPPHRYNYASPDCSARVISSSSGSQHASSVLHKSKDRYMLTPCNAKEHWVVIELCDEIRIEAIEIGMFEFFSGVVKDVVLSVDVLEDEDEDDQDVSLGEAQSNKSEWEEVGTFTAKNVRGNQVFSLPSPTAFHRFIRLDFPSYYGKEYYCPISSVKAYGMNQMEAFKWESRRNKQREDEWARKQVEEERKRKSTLAQVVEPVVESSSGASAGVPLETSRSRVTHEDQAQTSEGAQKEAVTAISSSAQSKAAEPSDTTVTADVSLDTNGSLSLPDPGQTETAADTPQDRTRTAQAQAPTSRVDHNNTVIPTTTVDEGDGDKPEQSTANATSSGVPTSTETATKAETRSDEPVNTTRINTKVTPSITMSAPPRQNNVKADSSESIYAFIIRRLNALEGNATLGMMYVEEQSRVNRGLYNRLEKSWTEWKLEHAQNQRLAVERERIATANTLEEMRTMISQRDALLLETVNTLKAQFDSMTEEIAWEKRRGIAQLLLLMIVIGLSALSRSATVDVQTVRPLMQARNSIAEQARRGKEKYPGTNISAVDQDKSPLVRTRSLGNGSRGSPRRPATPIQSGKKARPNLTLNARSFPDRLDAPRTAVPARSRQFLIPTGNTHMTGRRLARSSHLHTIDADRVRRKLQMDSVGMSATPTRSSQTLPSALLQTPTPNGTRQHFIEDVILDNGYSEHSEYELASASEAEADLDN